MERGDFYSLMTDDDDNDIDIDVDNDVIFASMIWDGRLEVIFTL